MLTIGGFAEKGKVSKRMLRYYDEENLLKPAYIGENGYRYYDDAQLSNLKLILKLNDYGFNTGEIKELLPLNESELAEKIHSKRLENYGQLNELKKKLRKMDDDIAKSKGADYIMEKYNVIIMEMPEQKVFTLRRTINISETHKLFEDLHKEMEKAGLKKAGPAQQMFMGDEFNYDALDIEAQVQVTGEGDGVKTIPAGTYAATTHIGPFEEVRHAYEALGKWIKGQDKYEVCGPGIERYIKDENSVNSPEELETGVLFPVKQK